MIKVGKIKINLASGASLEKPLVSCFKGTNANYVVLDNESNGSMGLPIIIISKLNGTNLEKIIDPNEWGAVKENLKTIIGGTALPYLPVPETLSAPDDFFTQLTLPVASYDLLKSVYVPPVVETAPVAPETPAAAVEAAPAAETPVAEVPATPAVETPAEITLAPIPEVAAPSAPAVPETPVAPVEAPVSAPEVTATPVVEPTPVAAPVAEPVVETPAVASPEVPAEVAPAVPAVSAMPVDTPAPVEAAPVVDTPIVETPGVPENPVAPVEAPVSAPEVPATPAAEPTPDAAPVAEPVIETPAVETTEDTTQAAGSAPAIDLPVSQPATTSSNADIDLIKETFMKSCENMFDALMKKFENKN